MQKKTSATQKAIERNKGKCLLLKKGFCKAVAAVLHINKQQKCVVRVKCKAKARPAK